MRERALRIITAVAAYDGHDASVLALNRALLAGAQPVEVISLGFNMTCGMIAAAALQEGADEPITTRRVMGAPGDYDPEPPARGGGRLCHPEPPLRFLCLSHAVQGPVAEVVRPGPADREPQLGIDY